MAGGSSGGSAAALAARMVPAAVARTPRVRCGSPPRCRVFVHQAHLRPCSPTGCIPLEPDPRPPRAHGPQRRRRHRAAGALATEPGGDPTRSSPGCPPARAPGQRPLAGLRMAVTGRPEAAAPSPTSLDGLHRSRRRPSGSVAGRRAPAPPDVAPQADSVTILFHEVWPYHAGHADRPRSLSASIREFVDLDTQGPTTPRPYAARPGAPRARSPRSGARGSPITAWTSCSSSRSR